MLSVIMLNVRFFKNFYAEFHHSESENRYAECHYAERHYDEYHSA
jgi:hypothetical protein